MAVRVEINKQREYGAYYTPASVSKVLSDWAIRDSNNYILEPGFGGCGFLEASKARLIELGVSSVNTNKHIFGCDIDQKAFEYLAKKIGPVSLKSHFIKEDFLKLTPSSFSKNKFDAVIGNPPYVSLHNMPELQRQQALSSLKGAKYKLGRRSSLWGYFILHATQFIKQGGRCAWVLPSSFLNANYALTIREFLEKNFAKVLIIPLSQRLFTSEGAEESTIILLAEGWMDGVVNNGSEIAFAELSDDLPVIVSKWTDEKFKYPILPCYEKSGFAYLRQDQQYSFRQLQCLPDIATLDGFVEIKIGIVTGANDFFIINAQTSKEKGIPYSALKPILLKLSQSKGLELTSDDLKKNIEQNVRCLLLNTIGNNLKLKGVNSYLDTFPKDRLHKIATFKKRIYWHQPDDQNNPDAFFSYMCDYGPRMTLNTADTTCTNSVHRIFFKDKARLETRMLLAISLQTSLTQLSAELVGRNYGSGVLKLEPSEASRLSIALPDNYDNKEIEKAFIHMNVLLRNNKSDDARSYANDFILKPLLKQKYDSTICNLEESIHGLRALRRNFNKT